MESTNTLRSLTINRITSDLIEGTISEVPDSFVIIIVDDYNDTGAQSRYLLC